MIRDADETLPETRTVSDFDRRVANFYEIEPWVRARVEVTGTSHVGKVRSHNEDHFAVVNRYRGRRILATNLPEGTLEASEDRVYTMAVADGLGGQRFGELASLLALQVGWELGGNEIKWLVKVNAHEVEEMREKAEVFCRLINQALLNEVRENPQLAGMATTLTLGYSSGPELFVIHVGDSRAYLLRGSTIQQLTRDHTLGQFLVDSGAGEPGSPRVEQVKHVLTNCLGGPDARLSVDVIHQHLLNGDRLLLCTDGLSDMVDDASIAETMLQYPAAGDACRALVERALGNGGRDNVTVIIANYQIDERPEIASNATPAVR